MGEWSVRAFDFAQERLFAAAKHVWRTTRLVMGADCLAAAKAPTAADESFGRMAGAQAIAFPQAIGPAANAPARGAATARDGNAAIAEEWNAAQANSASRDLFRQRRADWQPQASGGMRPSALAHRDVEQRQIAGQAEHERRQMLAELQQRQQRVAGHVSQTPLERTRQWLNQVNGSTSPMVPAQSSLFSTPVPYGNSSAEDWLRTYG